MNIRIGPYVYKVEYVPTVGYGDRLGEINMNTNTISIKDTLPESRKRVYLLHEVLHGLLEVADLNDHEDAERFIGTISMGMYEFMRNNIHVVDYLIGGSDE